jgi:hypothetical protein
MTDPQTARQEASPAPNAGDRFTAALHRFGASVSELVRRGNRRRVTLRDRQGTVWLRLPLSLAAVLLIVAVVSWAFFVVVLLAIVLFALGFQLSIDRQIDDAHGGADGHGGADTPTSAA